MYKNMNTCDCHIFVHKKHHIKYEDMVRVSHYTKLHMPSRWALNLPN